MSWATAARLCSHSSVDPTLVSRRRLATLSICAKNQQSGKAGAGGRAPHTKKCTLWQIVTLSSRCTVLSRVVTLSFARGIHARVTAGLVVWAH